MPHDAYQHIGDYMMPLFPPQPSDLGFLFGTRHGVPEFCEAAYALWREGMFQRLLVSGGTTGGQARSEAELIGEFNFLQQIAQAFSGALQRAAVQRIGSVFGEGIKSEFHDMTSWLPQRWPVRPMRSRTHMDVTA